MKNVEMMLRDQKVGIMKKIDAFKDEINAWMEKNSTEILEKKLTERMNEIIRVLTRELADKKDTNKNFKLVDKELKNIFTMALFGLRYNNLIPSDILVEALKHNLYIKTDIIATYLNSIQLRQNSPD
jgi:hypothetical protein